MIPGLIDSHIHIESTLLCPQEFARAVAPRGTAAVVCDPHEIANVLGGAGIEYMLAATADSPLTFYLMMPSCVPATHLEISGAALSAEDLRRFLAAHPERILGPGRDEELPGRVLPRPRGPGQDPGRQGPVHRRPRPAALGPRPGCLRPGRVGPRPRVHPARGGPGEAPAGHASHVPRGQQREQPGRPPARAQRVQRGQRLPGHGHPGDRGHMDHKLRHAMAAGVPPVRAVQMASINTVCYFGLRGRVRASLPMPGLMSDAPFEETAARLEELLASLSPAMGAFHGNPFALLSFLALPVIPAIKLTDQGLWTWTPLP